MARAVRQQVIATLGRFDELRASGQLDRLVHSGARFAAKAMVLSAASNDAAIKVAVRLPEVVDSNDTSAISVAAIPGPQYAPACRF